MVDFIDEVRTRSNRFAGRLEHLETEEATKNALVMPFIQMLGYNLFDPTEVVPEFTADFGNRRGEKVDYALVLDGQPVVLIEAKKYGTPLQVQQESQLFRYFSATNTRFGILTDGVLYRFFSDLDEPKQMDQKPFFEFNMLDFTDVQVEQLKQFHKENFNPAETIEAARELKYTNEVKRVLGEEMGAPSEEFVRFVLGRIEYPGMRTQNRIAQFLPLVKLAFNQFVSDRIDARLKSALESGNQRPPEGDAVRDVRPPAKPPVELPRDLFIKTRNGIEAKGREDAEGVVVLEGSLVAKETSPSVEGEIRGRRDTALEKELLVDEGDFYRLTQDHRFRSLSGAAAFVLGRSSSGPYNWRGPDGRRLSEAG